MRVRSLVRRCTFVLLACGAAVACSSFGSGGSGPHDDAGADAVADGDASTDDDVRGSDSGTYASGTLAVGARHACAIVGGGQVYCWGVNDHGQLGVVDAGEVCVTDTDASLDCATHPIAVPLSATAVELSAGYYSTCARTTAGSVQCWGQGDELGAALGTSDPSGPTQTKIGTDVVSIALGRSASYALHDGGALEGWGYSYYSELGVGTLAQERTPIPISAGVDAILVGGAASSACARFSDGGLSCWGSDIYLQIVDPPDDGGACGSQACILRPRAVDVGGPVVALALSERRGCAVLVGGNVTCFGDNSGLALGSANAGPAPTLVPNVANAVGVAVGVLFSCARLADGTARCWGGSASGETGQGTMDPDRPPGSVKDDVFNPLQGIVELGAGDLFACARLTGGGVRCWGDNSVGQLGVDAGRAAGEAHPVALPP